MPNEERCLEILELLLEQNTFVDINLHSVSSLLCNQLCLLPQGRDVAGRKQRYPPSLLSFLLPKPNPLEKLRGFGTEIKEKGFGPEQRVESRSSSPLFHAPSPRLRRDSSWAGRGREEGREKTAQQWRPTPWGLNGSGMLDSQDTRVALQKDICAQPRPRCQRELPDIMKEEVPQNAKGLSTFPKTLLFVPNILGWHIIWISSSTSKEEDSVTRLGLKCSVCFAENRNSLVV